MTRDMQRYVFLMERTLALFYKAGKAKEEGKSQEQVNTLLGVAMRDLKINRLPIPPTGNN
jgi:hypothetical protein